MARSHHHNTFVALDGLDGIATFLAGYHKQQEHTAQYDAKEKNKDKIMAQ
jgi:hypothetical protein